MNSQVDPAELVPAMQFLQQHSNLYPTEEKARTALNRRKKTGLSTATVVVSNKLFISPSRFIEWLSSKIEG